MIADRPDPAYEICTKFAPDCSPGQESQSSVTSIRESTRSSSSNVSRKKSRKSNSRNAVSADQASELNGRSLNQNDRSSSIRNLGLLSSGLTSSNMLKLNADATLVSRDNSAESDGLGEGGLHGEEDYYDSLNSADENEQLNSRPNSTRTAINVEPVYNPEPGINYEPVYNPEPGINYDPVYNPEPGINYEPVYNPEPGIDENDSDTNTYESENDSASGFSNASVFSTVVNGVKIKSLPGPRGNYFYMSSMINNEMFSLLNRHSRYKRRQR